MRVELTGVSQGRGGVALPATDLGYRSGVATLAVAETEQRPSVLGLIASGRMRPATGTVTLDGARRSRALRRRVALVDAPEVCDPAPNVSVAGVVAEELMFAGRPSNPLSARRFLDEQGMRELARTPIGDVEPAQRLRLLLELAALRPGVEGIVLVSPDRHGGDPAQWWALAEEFARRGLAVLVIAGEAASSVLSGTAAPPRPTTTGATTADPDTAPPRPRIRPSALRLRGIHPPASARTRTPRTTPQTQPTQTAPEGERR